MNYVVIILGILSNAFASILIKYAVLPPRSMPSFHEPLEAFKNWPFWLGILFYGLAFLLYSIALSRLPLNVAHPLFTVGAITLVSLFSYIVLKEPFTWYAAGGMVLILIGVILLTRKIQ